MNNHVSMKNCIFCDTELKKGKTKAVEHVISKDFLDKIGMLNKVQKGRYYEGKKALTHDPMFGKVLFPDMFALNVTMAG